jgi:hypothetical protein
MTRRKSRTLKNKPSSPKGKALVKPSSPKGKALVKPNSPKRKALVKPNSPKRKALVKPSSPKRKALVKPSSPKNKPKIPQNKPDIYMSKTLMDMPLEIFCKIWKNLEFVKLSYIKQLFTIKNQSLKDKISFCTECVEIDINDKNILSNFHNIKKIKFSGQGPLLLSYCIKKMPKLKEITFKWTSFNRTPFEEKYEKNEGLLLLDFLPFMKNLPKDTMKKFKDEEDYTLAEFGDNFSDYGLTRINDCYYIKADRVIHIDEDVEKGCNRDPTAKYIITSKYDKKYNLKSMRECISLIDKHADRGKGLGINFL